MSFKKIIATGVQFLDTGKSQKERAPFPMMWRLVVSVLRDVNKSMGANRFSLSQTETERCPELSSRRGFSACGENLSDLGDHCDISSISVWENWDVHNDTTRRGQVILDAIHPHLRQIVQPMGGLPVTRNDGHFFEFEIHRNIGSIVWSCHWTCWKRIQIRPAKRPGKLCNASSLPRSGGASSSNITDRMHLMCRFCRERMMQLFRTDSEHHSILRFRVWFVSYPVSVWNCVRWCATTLSE